MAQRYPSNDLAPSAQYLASISLYNDGDYVSAEDALALALKKNPDGFLSDDALYWLSWSRMKKGAVEEALKGFQRLSKEHPQSTLRERASGVCLSGVGSGRDRPARASACPGLRLRMACHIWPALITFPASNRAEASWR
jgi:outer membrane protein assembly factor BamD (BamD/ComL family)